MNITTNQESRKVMYELLQDEIDRCQALVDKSAVTHQTKTWSRTVGAFIKRDIDMAKSALKANNDTTMFRALRALRENI